MRFDLPTAQRYASEGRLEDWIHAYLTAGVWANQALSDGLKRRQRWWVGPVEIGLSRLTRACGPEPEMEFRMDPAGWERRTSELAKSFTVVEAVPPLIVEYRGGLLSVRDGNHRLEAMRRKGWIVCWVMVWFDRHEEYLAYRV